jgi:hypothetical protein
VSWDRKKGGPATGYFYESRRVPGKPHPVKVYRGRGTVGQLAASLVDGRRQERRVAQRAVRAEAAAVAKADELTAELADWARLLTDAWLVLTGHHNHKGIWRMKRG